MVAPLLDNSKTLNKRSAKKCNSCATTMEINEEFLADLQALKRAQKIGQLLDNLLKDLGNLKCQI